MTTFALPSALVRLAERSTLPLKRALLRRRVGRLMLEHVEGMPLVVLPEVFNPAVFRTSPLLLQEIRAHVRPGLRVLDVGTGTGVAAIGAALHGAQATAVDLNPEAVRCARLNTVLNRVDDRVSVRHGDLFAPVSGERFDVVVCNPPFFRDPPAAWRDLAWRSETFVERFCSGLLSVLDADGCALIVFSSHADEPGLLNALAHAGFATTPARSRTFATETVTVYHIARERRVIAGEPS